MRCSSDERRAARAIAPFGAAHGEAAAAASWHMFAAFEKASSFCTPPKQSRRLPRRPLPHFALPLPLPPPTRLAFSADQRAEALRPTEEAGAIGEQEGVGEQEEAAASVEQQGRKADFDNDDVSAARTSPLSGAEDASEKAADLAEEHLAQAFNEIDSDGSGYIDHSELKKLLHKLNVNFSEAQFVGLLAKLDGDGNGVLDRSEFVRFMQASAASRTCEAALAPCSPAATEESAKAEAELRNSHGDNVDEEASSSAPTSPRQDQDGEEDGSEQEIERERRRKERKEANIHRLVRIGARAATPFGTRRSQDQQTRLPHTVVARRSIASEEAWMPTEKSPKQKPFSALSAWWSSTRCKAQPHKQEEVQPQKQEQAAFIESKMADIFSFALGQDAEGDTSKQMRVEDGEQLTREPSTWQRAGTWPKLATSEATDITEVRRSQRRPSEESSQASELERQLKPRRSLGRGTAQHVSSSARKQLGKKLGKSTTVCLASQCLDELGSGRMIEFVGANPEIDVKKEKEAIDIKREKEASHHPKKSSPSPKPKHANPKTAAFERDHRESNRRKASNKYMERKLREFDLRNSNKLRNFTSKRAQPQQSQISDENHGFEARRNSGAAEVDLGFTIVTSSSSRPSHDASLLMQTHGRWESHSKGGQGAVQNEYLVFGLHGHPGTVTGIELTLPGTSANPRRCKIQFCTTSQHGPWNDAWNFVIEPKGSFKFRGRHQYGALARQFKDMIIGYSGSFEMAAQLMDGSGTGLLSRRDFETACLRFQKLCPAATMPDPTKIFREIDVEGSGQISLDDLFSEEPKNPVAGWWRLLMLDNWGSPNSIILTHPLRLFSTETAETSTHHDAFYEHTLVMEELVANSHQELLHTTATERMCRRYAHEYDLSEREVQDIFREYSKADEDGTGTIERAEFEDLLPKLHGVNSKMDLPPSRLEFFWRQADENSDDKINFEEFLVWWSKKSPFKGH